MLSGSSRSAPVTPMSCLTRRSTALTRFSTAECPTPNSLATTEYGVPSRTRTSIAIPLADEFELIKLMSWRVGRDGAYCDWAAPPRKAPQTVRLLARRVRQMGEGRCLLGGQRTAAVEVASRAGAT